MIATGRFCDLDALRVRVERPDATVFLHPDTAERLAAIYEAKRNRWLH